MKNKIYPCIWFNGNAHEAAGLYCSVFDGFSIAVENPMVVHIANANQRLMLLNGGPEFTPNPSVSFFAVYNTEEEVNKAWEKLVHGGFELMPLGSYPWSPRYAWLQDRYGVNWQLFLGKMEETRQLIIPALMYNGVQNGKAEQAVSFYTSIFTNSKLAVMDRYKEGEQDTVGHIKHARFSLDDFSCVVMDSSMPHAFSFSEGISLVVECETQEEIDYYWEKLTDGGSESQCGWLKDRYGLSWQVVPSMLGKLMSDPERSQRVVQAFMKMKKFDIEKLLNA